MLSKSKFCAHRGFPLIAGKCNYHGLTNPISKRCFIKPKFKETYDFDYSLISKMENDWGEMFFQQEMEVKCPWYLWTMNSCDFLHLKHVHSDGFDRQFEGQPYDICFSKGRRHSSHRIKVKNQVVQSYYSMTKKHVTDNFLHVLFFPRTSMTSFLDCFYSHERATPEYSNSCRVVTKFFLSKINIVPQFLVESAIAANKKILDEDKAVVEKLAMSFKDNGLFLPGEERVAAFLEAIKA